MMLLAFSVSFTPAMAQQIRSDAGWGFGWLDAPAWVDGPELDRGGDVDQEGVVGGKQVKSGKWNDAVGIVFGGSYVGCTGTLVGPKVVLTAAHCVGGYPITHVVVGSKDWLTNEGEIVEVDEVYAYPGGLLAYDAAVLTLKDRPTSAEPRAIALDCILRDHLRDGSPAQIVGFGVTTETGSGFNTKLNEAPTEILDKNCDETTINGVFAGCNASISPGGEIAAGGGGTDACFGDSGGPLYLKTDEGDFLVGITSRAFLGVNPQYPCRSGGIWVRPDAIIEWIEEQVGGKPLQYPSCNDAPEVLVDDILTWQETVGVVQVAVVDPDGDASGALVEIVQEPENGTAEIAGDGTLRYVPNPGFVGSDTVTLAVTDAGNQDWERSGEPVTVEIDVPVLVQEGRPPGACGCSTSSPPAAWALLSPLGLLALRRRR